jgi:hypothetical protein
LSIFGFIGWFCFLSADDSDLKAVSLVAVLALAALVGIMWSLSRALASRRWIVTPSRNWRRGLTHGGTLVLVLGRKPGERLVVPHCDREEHVFGTITLSSYRFGK